MSRGQTYRTHHAVPKEQKDCPRISRVLQLFQRFNDTAYFHVALCMSLMTFQPATARTSDGVEQQVRACLPDTAGKETAAPGMKSLQVERPDSFFKILALQLGHDLHRWRLRRRNFFNVVVQ